MSTRFSTVRAVVTALGSRVFSGARTTGLALWVVTGSEKEAMVERLLDGDPEIPAGRVRNHRALLLADCAAAPASRSLKKGGDENRATLTKLKGASFDRAYVDHEVAYHEQVLDAPAVRTLPDPASPEVSAPPQS